MGSKIKIGDQVQHYNSKGKPLLGTRFIVTDMGDGYIAGIDFGGRVYIFGLDDNWIKTGRHYDIIDALLKLRNEQK